MPLSVPLVLDPGEPGRFYTVHVHRVRWSTDMISGPLTADHLAAMYSGQLTADHLAALEANARKGLRLVSECVAAELADAGVEVIEHHGGAEAVARVLCDSEVCAAVAERYRRDAEEDVEAEAARAWAATKLPGQSVELLCLRGELERTSPGKAVQGAKDMLAALLAAQQERTGGATDRVVLMVDEAADLFRAAGLFEDQSPEGVRRELDRLIRQNRVPYPIEPAADSTRWGPVIPNMLISGTVVAEAAEGRAHLTPETLVSETVRLARTVAAGETRGEGAGMLALRCREVARRYKAGPPPPCSTDCEQDQNPGNAFVHSIGHQPRAVAAGEVRRSKAAATDWPLRTLPENLPQDDDALVLVYREPTPGLSSLLEAVRTGDDQAVQSEATVLVRALGWIAAEGSS
ncbi:hypothetical protein [Streptacidiphilus carbonis]|uniref:hypothetical protein n=1 Tax=Streptacidiphilus carbonis TaxID=105422 RepID=UPI0006932E3E|nr:hypothetical protein [Streptacidiphilus carbonis]